MRINKLIQLRYITYLVVGSFSYFGIYCLLSGGWKAGEPPLWTKWGKNVTPANAHREYPRPQMARDEWLCLNGLWEYAIVPKDSPHPTQFQGQILVPFPVESALSGVMKKLDEKSRLWYRRTFKVPSGWAGKRIILNFGAVDWEATVFVNGVEIGSHKGGYDPFSFDITDYLKNKGDEELVVAVYDPTEGGQPRGKQTRNPGGIMYTQSSGIWQTVWLEPVSPLHIKSIRITPLFDDSAVELSVNTTGSDGEIKVDVFEGKKNIGSTIEKVNKNGASKAVIKIPQFKAWTPESPFLYDVNITFRQGTKTVDTVRSYFGMRKISIGKDALGKTRILLNDEFVFQIGVLDQGFWPDGLYTAPSDEALRSDIEMIKKLGMNLARKHVKVEPQRWYYWCDRLGLLVWQDMPGANNITDSDKQQFELELKRMVENLINHPSVIMWVVFNEGWGQFDTERLVSMVKQIDPTRLVNNASGWTDKNVGDVIDVHNYPGPRSPEPEDKRAAVLGEFGGLFNVVAGHTWSSKQWGGLASAGKVSLTKRYISLVRKVYELKDSAGLSAAVYTQITDVETECNGIMTYDRAVVKMNIDEVASANRGILPVEDIIVDVVPTSEKHPVKWRYTLTQPSDDWILPSYNDGGWKEGNGGFGQKGTPGSVVRTEWKGSDIWLRREFELKNIKGKNLFLRVHHDEDVEIYLNGVLALKLPGYTTYYVEEEILPAALSALKEGRNVMAIHCKQTEGGQYIDAGIVEVISADFQKKKGDGTATIRVVEKVVATNYGGHYTANRAPLLPSPLIKLPIGSIVPRGWLKYMLELERDGMTGRLKEISPWLRFERSAWASPDGTGERGWEEMPYWLKGFGDLGYVLKDEKIIAEARKWIEAAMASQREDGWFGPRALLTSLKGKPDLWPHMVMLNVLQSYYEYSNDQRVLTVMKKYFEWQNRLPETAFGEGYWPKLRAGDNIESVYWLYNRIGEPWLLELAQKIHRNMARWDKDVINWHNVNIAQGFRAPAVFYMQSKDPAHLYAAERNYQKVMGIYGQFPGGGFAGDENCRPGYIDPRQGFETCGIVEFMHSFQMLTKISGDPIWADRCEEITFNSFPASMTPDLKALHYLTCANQVQLDRGNKAPGIQNSGTMFSYSPFEVYRCCQHNVSHGWPYYAEELWLATCDKGLCASLYAASEVTAKVGDGATVRIFEDTDYPFRDKVVFRIIAERTVEFPLYLRIPKWCNNPELKINGKAHKISARPLSYVIINRKWENGDVVELKLPMKISVRRWEKNKNSVSVDYGPLTFSLKIEERWAPYGKNQRWQEWEVFPDSAWNYGLIIDPYKPESSFEIVRREGAIALQPFTPQTAPILLKAKAKKIPAWQMDHLNLVGLLQPSPAKSDEPVETVTLIPMGAARLRISSFPTIGSGEGAYEWVAPSKPKKQPYKASASYVHSSDTVDAMLDGLEPSSSNDHSIPRFTWWNHRGTKEWVQYEFPKPMKVVGVAVYWFDDTGVGYCRVPQSWRLLYRKGSEWLPVEAMSSYGTLLDTYNKVKIKPVETDGLRIEVELKPQYSGGILEWKVQFAE